MIEKIQKKVLFEEASKKAVLSGKLKQISEIYKDLLGVSDIGEQVYGKPLAPLYIAREGEPIEMPRIRNFFTGLTRDITVSQLAIGEVEDQLILFNLEFWARSQLLKNRSIELVKRATVEKSRAFLGSTWMYTESFTNTALLDIGNTTAWIDTSEGISYLPSSSDEGSIPVSLISVMEQSLPQGGNFLGSGAKHAFDGMESTSWKSIFINNTYASTIISVPESNLTSISVDPVGFGIEVIIETDSGQGFESAVKAIVYSKKSFPVDKPKVKRLRVSFTSATTVLPKTVGIREIILYKNASQKSAEIYTKLLKPSDPFNEIRVDYVGSSPIGTDITCFYRTATGSTWKQINPFDWYSISNSFTSNLSVRHSDAVSSDSAVTFKGLYAIQVPVGQSPLSTNEGVLNIGQNMIEVSAFKKEWAEQGDIPHEIRAEDFTSVEVSRTWSTVPLKSYSSSYVIQGSGSTTISDDSSICRDGTVFAFQRKLDPDTFSSSDSQYKELCIVPLVADSLKNRCQYNYNYKLKYMVHCPSQVYFSDAKYRFYQGYRQVNTRSYQSLGKAYGSFSMYINGDLVAADSSPYTIYSDDSTDSDTGKSYSLSLNEGWNTVEIFISITDPNLFGSDAFESTYPYLQLSLYPSLFDLELTSLKSFYIDKVLASGQEKPTNEFDLLWNMPKSPIFWAWSEDRNYVLFNTNKQYTIDGYYKGESPLSSVVYRSITSESIDDLYIKLGLERNNNVNPSPILEQFTVMVR